MYGKIKIICVTLAMLPAAACMQRAPSVVESTTPTVTFQYDGSRQQLVQTSRQADQFCSGYSRQARLEETYRSGPNNYAVYSCP